MITRLSTLFLRTLREDPADAEVPSHRLLVRAGYIRRAAPGIYSWLPLGYRVLRNVERIVREEMDAIGAQEVHFPALLPREPYEATGRWTEYGDNIFRLKDRKGADYLLGPTHEEMFTLLVKDIVLVLQGPAAGAVPDPDQVPGRGPAAGRHPARPGVRDEGLVLLRPGRRRACRPSYQRHRDAYIRIFDRLGLRYVIVAAMSGAMGGSASEEFLADAEVGEDTYVKCTNCDYAANVEAVAGAARAAPIDASGAAGRARRGHPRHADHRHPGGDAQRAVPAHRPALGGGRHAEERAGAAPPPRRQHRAAGDRRARRPRGRPQAAGGAGRAGRGRAVHRGRTSPPTRRWSRATSARGARRRAGQRDPLPARPARRPTGRPG